MRPPTIGIIDYGVGNLASVWHALHALEFRCRVSGDPQVLGQTDLLLLPGVGAFPAAMEALRKQQLDDYLRAEALRGRPIVGICLGMQLLAEGSLEHRHTQGLGLVSGMVRPVGGRRWHIGWNTLEHASDDPIFAGLNGQAVYFNHSFSLEEGAPDVVAVARIGAHRVCAAVRRGNVVGLQFHPEKSQGAGRGLLRTVVKGFCK